MIRSLDQTKTDKTDEMNGVKTLDNLTMDEIIDYMQEFQYFKMSQQYEPIEEILKLCGFNRTIIEGIELFEVSKSNSANIDKCKEVSAVLNEFIHAKILL